MEKCRNCRAFTRSVSSSPTTRRAPVLGPSQCVAHCPFLPVPGTSGSDNKVLHFLRSRQDHLPSLGGTRTQVVVEGPEG